MVPASEAPVPSKICTLLKPWPCPNCDTIAHPPQERESRAAREAAVENWLIAVSFWEVHLVRRCFERWAAHKGEVLAKALHYWGGATVGTYFRRWVEVSGYGRC